MEKSVKLNEYLIDLFTPPGGVVFDMFAGTASMGIACIKTDRVYVGTEPDEEVHRCAELRLGKTWTAKARHVIKSNEPGLGRQVAEQVMCFCCVVDGVKLLRSQERRASHMIYTYIYIVLMFFAYFCLLWLSTDWRLLVLVATIELSASWPWQNKTKNRRNKCREQLWRVRIEHHPSSP